MATTTRIELAVVLVACFTLADVLTETTEVPAPTPAPTPTPTPWSEDEVSGITANCSEEQEIFYRDVYSQAWLSKILVVGTPFEVLANDNQSYFLRVMVKRVLKGDQNDLQVLYNSRNSVPIFVRVSRADEDAFVDQRCVAFRLNRSYEVPLSVREVVQLSAKYFFFLEPTDDPTMFKPLFKPIRRKRSVENGIKKILCNSTTTPCETSPRLKVPTWTVIGQVGGSITLPCESSNVLQAYLQWSYPVNESDFVDWFPITSRVPDGESYSVDTGTDGKGLVLTIDPLEFSHSGLYRCYGRNLIGESEVTVQLRVLNSGEYKKYAPKTSTRIPTIATSQSTAEIDDDDKDKDDEPITVASTVNCSGVACCNSSLCRRNPQCSCPPATATGSGSGVGTRTDRTSAYAISVKSSSSSVFSVTSGAPVVPWSAAVATDPTAFYDRQLVSNAAVRYGVAAGSFMLLVLAVSIVVLYACRVRRRRSDGHRRASYAKEVLIGSSSDKSTRQLNHLDSSAHTTCTTSLSTTNSSGSACGSTSSSSAVSQKSACAIPYPPHANSTSYAASASHSRNNSTGKRPEQFDFEDDESDNKSPASDAELCLGAAVAAESVAARRLSYKRPDSKVKHQHQHQQQQQQQQTTVAMATGGVQDARDVYVSLSMPSDARSFSSQALSSAFVKLPSDCQRMAQSRSLHMLPARSANGRLCPVQEIPSDQDDLESDRHHPGSQTYSLDRRRLLSRGRSEDEAAGGRSSSVSVHTQTQTQTQPIASKFPSQASSRSCGGVIRNPSTNHRRNVNVYLTDEIPIDSEPLRTSVTFANPASLGGKPY